MNNRGQVFALILVFITLFLCGLVLVFYLQQSGNVNSSLVSPRDVFEIRDDLEIFEMREVELINSLVENSRDDFGSDEFVENFREGFLAGVVGDEDMSEFIFRDLFFSGRDVEGLDREDFLSDNLYSDVVEEDGKLVFGREIMGKSFDLRAEGKLNKIKFPVGFVFEFEKSYLIDENGVAV